MAQILLITHGELAHELVDIAEQILHIDSKALPICICFDAPPEQIETTIQQVFQQLDPQIPTIILTDLFGGTPSNLTLPFIEKGQVEVITGVNLAMLLFLLTNHEKKSLEVLCQGAQKAGRDAIVIASEFLS